MAGDEPSEGVEAGAEPDADGEDAAGERSGSADSGRSPRDDTAASAPRTDETAVGDSDESGDPAVAENDAPEDSENEGAAAGEGGAETDGTDDDESPREGGDRNGGDPPEEDAEPSETEPDEGDAEAPDGDEADEDGAVEEAGTDDGDPGSVDGNPEAADVPALADDADADDTGVADGLFGGGRTGGPAEDREMPLADHIREMLRRLAVVIAVAGLVSLFVFPFAEEIINLLWYSILPGVESEIARPRLYSVLDLLFTQLKVASLAGLIVALPVLVYETYAFMRPGLYPHERRYYLAAIPTSLVLAVVGVSFAYFVVLPAIFVYFLYYSQDVATIGFALGRTFDLILLLMGYMAIVFQIPLFIMLAVMMGLVTRRWLADRRLLFWGAFLGLSFLFSPDPTGMAPILVAATMIALFEGTLLLTRWTGRE